MTSSQSFTPDAECLPRMHCIKIKHPNSDFTFLPFCISISLRDFFFLNPECFAPSRPEAEGPNDEGGNRAVQPREAAALPGETGAGV